MYNINKYLRNAALVGGVVLIAGACNKERVLSSQQEGTIYMPQAVDTRADLSVLYIDSAQTYTFGDAYGGVNTASRDISSTFVLDTSLISSYNAANGTSYVVIPDSAYTISGLTTTMKAGTTSSNPLSLTIQAKKLSFNVRYMLPIRMTSISSGKFDTALSISYFRIDTLQIRSKDVTAQGKLSVLNENDNGASAAEGSPHLVDGDVTTKYLSFEFPAGFWYQLLFPTALEVDAYTMTSANDSPDRDPYSWHLDGSNDGTNWTVLDTRTGEQFADREVTNYYVIANHGTYTYYRMVLTALNGSTTLFQQAEWRLIQYY